MFDYSHANILLSFFSFFFFGEIFWRFDTPTESAITFLPFIIRKKCLCVQRIAYTRPRPPIVRFRIEVFSPFFRTVTIVSFSVGISNREKELIDENRSGSEIGNCSNRMEAFNESYIIQSEMLYNLFLFFGIKWVKRTCIGWIYACSAQEERQSSNSSFPSYWMFMRLLKMIFFFSACTNNIMVNFWFTRSK